MASTRADYLAAELARTGWRVEGIAAVSTTETSSSSAIVADLDEWQSHWGLLSSLRSTMHVVLDGCSLSDVRMVTRLRTVPPPLPVGSTMAWEYRADNTIGRIRLPIDPGAGRAV
ncbi:hypothetical protein [Antiquaquibacter oligotrophicus]|uniref:hypothetical protein n=1 Tax=Antiquaquibacter oligotrophicus TaxID=2880260 RepID=UPI002AC9EC71|nr:hypothetical protein [Antiquaquibacter oligotrophicus]